MAWEYQGYRVQVDGKYVELYDYLSNARVRAKFEAQRNPTAQVEIHTWRAGAVTRRRPVRA